MIRVHVTGLDDNLDRMTVQRLLDDPMRKFMTDAGRDMVQAARRNAPIWTGELRDSLGAVVDKHHPPMFAIIGPRNAQPGTGLFWKAVVAEYGSGIFAEKRGARHSPPIEPLEPWALAHGFESGAVVARIIRKRGGIRPKRFLRRAAESVKRGLLKAHVKQLETNIRLEWDKP